MRPVDLTTIWAETFGDTVVITTEGGEARVARLFATLPFASDLVRIDRYPAGYDCLTGRPHPNHHVIVGNRHKRIIQEAARKGLKNVCILEDDAEFTGADPKAIAGALRWMSRHPQAWDIFYLGFGAPFLTRCSYVTRHVIRAHRPFLAHAICYHQRTYSEIDAIDFEDDHRPSLFRTVERLVSPGARTASYFREGVGSLDTWLSFSKLRKLAAYPPLVVQTVLPPGTEESWTRRTGRPYDVRLTPGQQATVALAVHYGLWGAGWLLVLGVLGGFYLDI